jgi:hypothetical protein
MDLALRRACTYSTPRYEIREVLRRDHVQELAARGQAELIDLEQQTAREPQPVIDTKAAVEIGIVDQSFPAHSRARFLKINPHDDFELGAESFALFGEPTGIFESRVKVVNRAGADDHRQPIVLPVQDLMHGAPAAIHGGGSGFRTRKLAVQLLGRAQLANVADSKIVGTNAHCVGSGSPINMQKKTASGLAVFWECSVFSSDHVHAATAKGLGQ